MRTWFQYLARRIAPRPPIRRSTTRRRLSVERLDDRNLPSTFNTFALPTPNSAPTGIVAGPDGALWFTESGANKIGRITPSGAVTEFALPTSASGPLGIAVGSDGALWFTENNAFQIGRITTAGAVTEFRLPATGYKPVSITAGPDGALWFTEVNANNPATDQPTSQPIFEPTSHPILGGKIGRITTGGAVTEFAIPTGADPNGTPRGITTGPDGNLWFTERNASDRPAIGRLTPGGAYTEFATVNVLFSQSGSITVGPDGNLWFTVPEYPAYVGRITTSGTVASFDTVPTSGPRDIAVGADGNLWFTQYDQMFGTPASITRITPAGVTTQFALADTSGGPFGMAADRNGNLWFTELVAGKIGELDLSTPAAASTQTSLAANVASPVFGQPVTLTATVTSIGSTPGGTVTFFDGGVPLGSATLNAPGQATLTLPLGAAGLHSLTAAYAGASAFAASTSGTLEEHVSPAATATTLSASVNPALAGQPVVFTATVAAVTPGAGTATGSVTFLDGGATLGTAALGANGRAAISVNLAAGSHAIKAVYGGGGNFLGSSQSLTEQVNSALSIVPSVTVLSASASSVKVGQTVTFTATVSAAAGTGTPTGIVKFMDGNIVLGTVTLDSGGRATFSTSFATAGSHIIKAVYSGDFEFGASEASFTESVVKPRKW
jgi:streptogramin lyase